VRFDDFERHAWQCWEKVPSDYKHGVDRLIVERVARTHPEQSDIYTLGECLTESFPSDFGGPDTTRSAVVLYYGSFLRLAQEDADFEWEQEVWETLTHELQHHLEALARDDSLEDFDYAVDENFKRLDGTPFDPLFYRAGTPIGQARYEVDDDIFIELAVQPTPAGVVSLEFEWQGTRFRLVRPLSPSDITYVRILGGPQLERGELWLVLVRQRSVLRQLGDALRRLPLEVSESEAVAEPVG
jgi:predicted Zn-dependent protease with MMP-like domain